MSGARLIIRIIMATITVIAVGSIGVIGFMVIEPFAFGLAGPPSALGWGDLTGTTLMFGSLGILGLLLVLILWFVYAPIRRDRRQQFRR